MKEVILSKYCDFCDGVKRTIDICNEVLGKDKDIYSIGQVIHNSKVTDNLKRQGLQVVENVSEIPEGSSLLIRSHGISPTSIRIAKEKNIKLINAACPFVEYIQNICKKLIKEKYFVIITGDMNHPEVETLTDIAGQNGMAISEPDKNIKVPGNVQKVGVISQSTYTRDNFYSIISKLFNLSFPEIRLFDTICNDSLKRREEVKKIALLTDVVWVIGGTNSANTMRLFQIAKKINEFTYHLNDPDKTDKSFFDVFKKVERLGVIGGASTPRWIIDAFLNKISESYKMVLLEELQDYVS